MRAISGLVPYAKNARTHSPLQATGQTFEDVADERYDFRKYGFASYQLWCAHKREGRNASLESES